MKQVWVLLALALPLAAAAERARTTAVVPADVMRVQELDEVVVTGSLESLRAARKAVVEAEDRFYARYNAINDDHAYDMLCREDAPTGTLIRRRICEPRVVEDALAEDAQRMVSGNYVDVTMQSREVLRATALVEAKRRLLKLLDRDPELRRALLERARLQQHLDALHQRKFEGRWIVWD